MNYSPNCVVELVGDRRLIRFLRGRQNDVGLAAGMYREHLKWRKGFNTDEIRNKIAFGGLNHPLRFPFGEKSSVCCQHFIPNSLMSVKINVMRVVF